MFRGGVRGGVKGGVRGGGGGGEEEEEEISDHRSQEWVTVVAPKGLI
ncbi:hypothetical protein M0802_002042 [Mischocyttarus mexicanus]|nr:hypothetical protein M0802_002042 [Mischocyttarus mexicanus]